MIVTLNGTRYDFRWAHRQEATFIRCGCCGVKKAGPPKRWTECRVYAIPNDPDGIPYSVKDRDGEPLVGTAVCGPDDRYVKEIGRRISLGRLLEPFVYRLIWAPVHARGGGSMLSADVKRHTQEVKQIVIDAYNGRKRKGQPEAAHA